MEFYHLVNHAVETRDLFLDSQDYARFVHDLFEFNDTRPALNAGRPRGPETQAMIDLRNQSSEREMLVNIHAWCLMKNHYHLFVSELIDGGVTMFIRKLNIGFANYVNEKYNRHGTLFRGRTKKVRIETDEHLFHVIHYVHLNPLDFLPGAQEWRQGHIADVAKAWEHLGAYRWSSLRDYIGTQNFPSILYRGFVDDVYPDYADELQRRLKHLEEAAEPAGLAPEYWCERGYSDD